MENTSNLSVLMPGEKAIVTELDSPINMRRRFSDIGLIKGTEVKCVGKSPLGDPSAYLIRGAVIAIRREDAKGITVKTAGGER